MTPKNEALSNAADSKNAEIEKTEKIAQAQEGYDYDSTPRKKMPPKSNLEALKLLISARPDLIDVPDNNGYPASSISIYAKKPQITIEVIRARANVDFIDPQNFSLLHVAVLFGEQAVVAELIMANADLNQLEGQYARSPIFCAIQEKHTAIVDQLINAKCALDIQAKGGWTALMYAVARNELTSAELLVTAKANLNLVREDGFTALLHASYYDNLDAVNLLIVAGAGVNFAGARLSPLHAAALSGNGEIIAALIAANADLNSLEKQLGATPLYCAVQNNHPNIVDKLLRAGALVNLSNTNSVIPLIKSLNENDNHSLKLLVDARADVNQMDNNGHSPMFIAVVTLNTCAVNLLVRARADLGDVLNKAGETPLEIAQGLICSEDVKDRKNEVIELISNAISLEEMACNVVEGVLAGVCDELAVELAH